MIKDQIRGKIDQAAGSVKQKVGEALGNQSLANQGVTDQIKGAVKEVWGNAKEAVKDAGKTKEHHAKAGANDVRRSLSDKVRKAKKHINSAIDEQRHDSDKRRSA